MRERSVFDVAYVLTILSSILSAWGEVSSRLHTFLEPIATAVSQSLLGLSTE